MFEVGGSYENRIGKYTIVEMRGDRMVVQYENGEKAELSIGIQRRIWENILSETQPAEPRKRAPSSSSSGSKFFIKIISIVEADELGLPDYTKKIAVEDREALRYRTGDRFAYLNTDVGVFFAVATITGGVRDAKKKDTIYDEKSGTYLRFLPLDIDALAPTMEHAVPFESVELESQPNSIEELMKGSSCVAVTELEFESIAEMVAELTDTEDEEFPVAEEAPELED